MATRKENRLVDRLPWVPETLVLYRNAEPGGHGSGLIMGSMTTSPASSHSYLVLTVDTLHQCYDLAESHGHLRGAQVLRSAAIATAVCDRAIGRMMNVTRSE